MGFKVIDYENWPRKPYFEYYKKFIDCQHNVTDDIDITEFMSEIKKHNLKFYLSYIYIITTVVNRHDEFKVAYDKDGNLGIWDILNPSYTIFHKDDNTFSDMWSYYNEDFKTFYENALEDMKKYSSNKGVKAREGQPPNFLSISSVPWRSFKAYAINSGKTGKMLFPIITFGKYYEKDGRIYMPLSTYLDHCVVDGFHVCRLYNEIEEFGKIFKYNGEE